VDKEPDRSNDIEILKLVHSHFDQDLREFWVRNNMYLVVTGILISVFASTVSRGPYALIVGVFGLIISLFWFAVARASYRWICAWREELCRLDSEIDRFQAISRVEQLPMRPLGSATWITQWLSVVISIGWIALLLGSVVSALT
jgi:hypothetical protein